MSASVRIGSQTLVDYHAQGAFNYRDESGRLDDSNGQHMFFNRPYAYLMPAGSHVWCQYDLTSLGRGFLLGALGGFKDDPADTLVNLKRFGSYKTVGDERLFGVKTTHYVGHINLSRLRNQPPNDPATQQQLDAISAVNAGKLPVDVWLSSDNVVSRLGTSF